MNRVNVIGTSSSGKTTLAIGLAERLGVPYIELDALHWEPNWTEAPNAVMRERVRSAIDGEAWVVDGNYSTRLGSLVLGQADQVVWLDLPLWTTFPRVLRRTLRRVRTREVIWGTNRESFRSAFLSRDSILLYSLRAHRRFRRSREQLLAGYPHVRLRSTREVERYLA